MRNNERMSDNPRQKIPDFSVDKKTVSRREQSKGRGLLKTCRTPENGAPRTLSKFDLKAA